MQSQLTVNKPVEFNKKRVYSLIERRCIRIGQSILIHFVRYDLVLWSHADKHFIYKLKFIQRYFDLIKLYGNKIVIIFFYLISIFDNENFGLRSVSCSMCSTTIWRVLFVIRNVYVHTVNTDISSKCQKFGKFRCVNVSVVVLTITNEICHKTHYNAINLNAVCQRTRWRFGKVSFCCYSNVFR